MFLKFANADLLEAQIAVPGGGLLKSAHKAVFNYTPREGYLYVRSRAISNRTNDNFDTWPEDELRQAYSTFIGKPVFVNHHNDDVRRKRGVIIDAALHEDIGPDGRPDVWIEVLMEIDAIRFPKLAAAILAGDIERTSMGADVGESECSYCGNVATTPSTYCAHIKSHKGRRLARRNTDGTEEQVLVHEICRKISFFENSVLVEPPADPTAFFLGVDDSGVRSLGMEAKVAARGGERDRFRTKPDAATKKLASDAIKIVRDDESSWSAIAGAGGDWYDIGFLKLRRTTGGWSVDEIHVDDGYRRQGVATKLLRAAEAEVGPVAHSGVEDMTADGVAWARSTGADVQGTPGAMWNPLTAKISDDAYVTLTDEQKARFAGTTVRQDDDGFYCHTHRARGKSYPSIDEIPDDEIGFIESTGSKATLGRAVRGFSCDFGLADLGREAVKIYRRMESKTATVDDLVKVMSAHWASGSGVGNQWALEDESIEFQGWGDHGGGAYDYAWVDDSELAKNWVASILDSKPTDEEIWEELEDNLGAVMVVLVGTTDAKYSNPGWDAAIPIGSTITLDEIRYNAGWGWVTLRANGRKVKASREQMIFEAEVQQEMTKMATKKKDRWRKTAGALDYGPLAPGPRAGTRWEGIVSTPNSRAYEVTVLWPGDEAPMLSGVFDSEERAQEWAQMCVDAGGRSVLIENAGNFQRVSKLRSEGATQAEADQLLASLDPEHRRMLEKFVPYTVYGPNYSRSITSNLMDAIMFARRGEEKYFLLAWSKCEAALDIATGGEDNWYYDSAMGQYTKRLASKTASTIVWKDDPTSLTATQDGFTVNQIAYDGQHALIVFGDPGQTFHWTVEDRNTSDFVADGAAQTLERAKSQAEEAHLKASGGQLGMFGSKTASTKLAWGETKAPPQVNTLGITECPVCGTTNQFDSTGRCMTCGHLPAPEPFREPDLEVAQKVDMRDGWVNPSLLSAPAFVPPAEDGAGGEENHPADETGDPVQKASSATEVVEGLEGDTMRPSAAIIASQEQKIARLAAENAVLRRRAGLIRTADEENPGQPVPEPAAQAPAQSTGDARAADATTDVTTPGSAITDVSPMATTDVTTPGAAATNVAPAATQDVTAPVAGGAEMPSYEQSVTLVQPDASGANNGTDRTNAFAEDNSWVQSAEAVRARTFACLRLAKLRIQAGLESDDDLVIAQRIEASKPSDDAIRTEIRTLTAVVQKQAAAAPRRREAARTAPSLASIGSPIVSTASKFDEADPVLW